MPRRGYGFGFGRHRKRAGGGAASALPAMKGYAATMAVYDPSDLTTMWQDRAGTTTQAVVGQPLGYMKNVKPSATALHMIAPTDARRPVLAATGPSFDGVDDALADAATAGLPASVTVLALVKTTDTDSIILARNDLTAFIGCWDATAGAVHTGAGTPTVKVDGTGYATRSALKAAINDGVTHTVLIEAANLSTWNSVGFSNYTGGAFVLGGTIVPVAILDAAQADYATALTSAQAWAAELKTKLGL